MCSDVVRYFIYLLRKVDSILLQKYFCFFLSFFFFFMAEDAMDW